MDLSDATGKIPATPGIDPGTFRLVAQCLNHYASPDPIPHALKQKYILSLMLLIMDNPNNFQAGLEIHGLHTRSKNQFFIPISNLTRVQKGIIYFGIKIYNSLLSNILNLKNGRRQYKNESYRYLLNNSLYSFKEFLEFSSDN